MRDSDNGTLGKFLTYLGLDQLISVQVDIGGRLVHN